MADAVHIYTEIYCLKISEKSTGINISIDYIEGCAFLHEKIIQPCFVIKLFESESV